ncbi:Ankyrin-1 [Blattella germanica]|nr:Ankyrin-1 [Blattella germanica]
MDVQFIMQEGLKQRETFVQCYDGDDFEGSPLHDAVCANQLETVQLLLDWGAKMDYIDPYTKGTPIHWAARYGHLEILKLIYAKGGSMLIKDGTYYENTPIYIATLYGHKAIVKWLVSIGVSVDEVNKFGETPLIMAVKGNKHSTQVIQTLIDLGANFNCVDNKDMTPLHIAVKFGTPDTLKLLLKNRAITRVYCLRYGFTPLHWAVRFGMLKKLMVIHSYDSDLSYETKNISGDDPVHLAAKFGHVEIMKWLFSHGCAYNANKLGLTPLHSSVINQQPNIIEYLVSIGVNLQEPTMDTYRLTALHIAAYMGLDDIVTFLLNIGADVNAKSAGSLIPLHYAIKENRVKCVEILLKFSATSIKPSVEDSCKALLLASNIDAADCMRWLIKNGISANLQGNNYETALHRSAMCGSTNTTKVLLENGANVNARTFELRTPLHVAVIYRRYNIVALLLQFGADVNATCNRGHTASHYAFVDDLVRLLKLAESDLSAHSKK